MEVISLWDHQKKIIAIAEERTHYAIFAEMGTGKTCTAIQILRLWCARNKRPLRTLVLCPPAVRNVWKREIERFSKLGKYTLVLDGSGKKREKDFAERAFNDELPNNSAPAIFITNYESLLMKELFQLFKTWGIEVLILDESQRAKDLKSKRTKLCIELADTTPYKLLLTGTPILNTAMDIWSQFRILDKGETFDRNFYAFRARYFYDRNANMPTSKHFPDWRPLPGLAETFNKLIYAKATRVLKKDCLDLPPLVRQRVEVDLSPEQERMYVSMRDEYVAYMGTQACVASIALTKILRLQQMVSGFWVDDEEDKPRSFKDNPRLIVLKELLKDIAHTSKVIVWASFRHSYVDLIKVCEELEIPHVCLYGGMTDKSRQVSIDSFQTDSLVRVMIANPAAGGVGITLTAASYMIYYSRTFSLEHDLQSEARAHRGGSEIHAKITRIDIVTPGTVDEVILDALERKENLASDILRIKDLL